MNFLSHYYFNRHDRDPELILGAVFPDLLKNADKTIRLHPENHELDFVGNPRLQSLYKGWTQHLEVDRVFHNLPFFYEHTHDLRLMLVPVVEGSPVRASFLSHIALELLLDHLLLLDQHVREEGFYTSLQSVNRETVQQFLRICGVDDATFFLRYLDRFIGERYIGRYRDLNQVSAASLYICQRVWDFHPDAQQKQLLTAKLAIYKEHLLSVYMSAFEEITYRTGAIGG